MRGNSHVRFCRRAGEGDFPRLANAFLWERQRYEPRNHADRERAVALTADLRPASASFRLLWYLAVDARYTPRFRITRRDAEAVVLRDLEQVAATVRRALDVNS
jgi:hypothetical protein